MGNSPGLRFLKFDLHTHTPASKCYKHKDHTPQEIIQKAIEKGLAAIAITDHNTAAWIDNMKEAAATIPGHPLVIFPGVEISTHEGFHLVALFDPMVGRIEIENFLGAIGITPEKYGRSEEQCKESVYKIIDLIRERNGLSIIAHIDVHKGAFYELTKTNEAAGKVSVPAHCAQLFNDERYDAVEVVNGKLPHGFDSAHGIKRKPVYYQSSDNPDPDEPTKHSKDGLATRYTFFKIDEISLEGLRQCFADPEVRIRQMDELKENAWPHIISMRVGNAGFLADQEFIFHPGLNSLIGGKGVGKSLTVEFLRFGLGQPSVHDEIIADHRNKLEKRLTPFNTLEVEISLPNGPSYLIKHTYQGNGAGEYTCINQTTGEPYVGDLAQLFPILAYSQTEVIKITEDESAQLRLIDSLFDTRPYQKSIEGLQEQLKENDRLVADALDAKVKVDEARLEVATLNEKIANIDKALKSPLLLQIQGAEAKKKVFEDQLAYLDKLTGIQRRLAEETSELELPALEEELAQDPTLQSNQSLLQKTRQVFLDALNTASKELNDICQTVASAQATWLPEFDTLRQSYENALQGTDSAQLEIERRQLVEAKDDADRERERFERQAEDELPELLRKRNGLLDSLDDQYQAYYNARKSKFDHLTQVSEERLKLSLEHATNREAYKDAVKALWKGSGPLSIASANREKIADNVSPRQLIDMIISRDTSGLTKASGLTQEMSERAIQRALAAENFSEVLEIQHAYYPEDTPSIQFNKGNRRYAPLNELSVGQKCTALLIIALCDGTMPVVIDQPEDSLDIASVWNDLAIKLRRGKDNRQFILTTHNSSLAVGGDSDSFMVLEPASGECAKIAQRGAIDRKAVRQEIINHLEGGDSPYKLKHRKYNIR